ncbi:ComF family protein [Virgibacillus ainsalahensis]
MHCLWCNSQLIPEISWVTILTLSIPKQLCESCEKELEDLHGSRCSRCSRISEEKICADCSWWEAHPKRDTIVSNHSVFSYNSMMQEMIAKWKYRGDYHLGHVFKQQFTHVFQHTFSNMDKDLVAVPIPLSKERQYERGFNQAKMLADFLPIQTKEVLTRVHGEKQSKKTRRDRILTDNPFEITETLHNTILLVDDIYTTGTTLRHAAGLLKAHGCPNVYAYTLIRG